MSIDKTDTPTLNDVRNYVREKGLKIDPERFFLYYQSRGWRIKGDIIFDWKALVESWEKGEGQIIPINGIKKKILPAQDFQQRDYTEEEMERNSNSVLNSLIKEKEAAN